MLKKYVHKLLTTPPDVSKSSVSRKQKPHRRLFSFTLLQGKEMTPFGCHTAVSVIQGNGGETPAVVQRKRVLLPSVPPHSTWKTHPSKFEEIVKERKIITPLTSVARRRKGSVSTPQGLAPLVCPHAASGACRRCPWMAVTKDGGSSREKLDLLHRTVHASGIGRSHSVPLELLPPYTVKAGLHQQQEVLLRYDPGPSHTEEGRFRLPPAADLPRCLLLSLEQKRLSLCLTTWASTLPTSARQALRGAFVCQSPHSQLSVTVWMEKDVHFTGQQSPLCGPSHPADVLSVEEQKLIDAVLQAAPLVREVAVDVCFIEEGTAERLHPSLQRRPLPDRVRASRPQSYSARGVAGGRDDPHHPPCTQHTTTHGPHG
ncbi:hypothetical protein ADEAN_000345200 [Angomonas deanei]|uniref:Uncharacterized protein n=1 Tax=Angomonas deanei TaxID=59799 RepID=A0A7G2CAR6_9TRYP|nr:hypothetical protein ADEAN_000345200 [Angomonas deanei]